MSKESILESLQNLSEEELEALASILDKPKKPTKKTTKKTTKKKTTKKSTPKKSPQTTAKKRSSGRPTKKTKARKSAADKNKKINYCKVVPFDTSKKTENRFFEIVGEDECAEDKEIDKKLSKGRKPRKKTNRSTLIDNVACSRCEYVYDDVPIKRCYKLIEETDNIAAGEYVFVCDECVQQGIRK